MATPYLPGHSGSLTYYNPFPTDPARAREHWLNYLSNATLAKYTADSIGRLIERSSREQLAALDEVNGTLQQGFAGVQGGLLAVADGVRGLTAEQARGNHLLALANAQLDGLNTGVEQANRTLSTIDSRLVLLVEHLHVAGLGGPRHRAVELQEDRRSDTGHPHARGGAAQQVRDRQIGRAHV